MSELAGPKWSDELPAGADVVVVGAGIVGAAIAARLARAGAEVCLLERSGPAAGSSSSGEGNLLVSDKLPGPELDLALRSLVLWQEVDAEAAERIELERKGGLVVAWDEAQLAALQALAAAQEAAGVAIRHLGGTELVDAEPHLSGEVAGAVFYEADSQVQPMYAVAHLLAQAAANGCRMMRGTEVCGWRTTPRGSQALETTLGSLRVGTAVVNAAGSWAGELAARLGSDLPVAPRRGHVLVTEPMPVVTAHKVYEADYVGSIHDQDDGWRCSSVVEATASGTMLLGSSRELVGWSAVPDPQIVASIAARAIRLFRGLAAAKLLRTYVGFRPATPDRLPAIGWDARVPGLLHATGHEGAGIGLSLATAEAVQCLLCKTVPPVGLQPFDPARFSKTTETRPEP
ncbi:MAG: FAD-dependent oxidoreductase [Actinomycetota bacterium]|nr:FAD-dependent oxidoreductase [Actinomycetota bacterium]